jgi:FtsH-binding integral membrane protein
MQTIPAQSTEAQIQVNTFIRSVYNWMAIGLGLTGFVAFYVSHSDSMLRLLFEIVGNQMKPTMLFYGFIIGELVLVFSLASRVNKMQASTATSLFVLYAALNGVTLSSIFLIYTSSSIASTFFICAATFVASSIFGMAYDTQKLKAMALSQPDGLDEGVVRKGAIIGALTLYLDFILMFQYLLFILGGSRD